MPSSVQSMFLSCFAMGSLMLISPPPPGATPLLTMFSARPSSTPNCLLIIGSVTVRMVSTEMSTSSLVIPCRVRSTGFLAKRQTGMTTSRKYPMARAVPQSCEMRLPPVTMPGLYLSVVPVSLISTFMPFVSLSSRRSNDAS